MSLSPDEMLARRLAHAEATALPSWDLVAPLLERWQMALVPYLDGTWEVRVFGHQHRAAMVCGAVPFARLPQAIQDLAARCAAAERDV